MLGLDCVSLRNLRELRRWWWWWWCCWSCGGPFFFYGLVLECGGNPQSRKSTYSGPGPWYCIERRVVSQKKCRESAAKILTERSKKIPEKLLVWSQADHIKPNSEPLCDELWWLGTHTELKVKINLIEVWIELGDVENYQWPTCQTPQRWGETCSAQCGGGGTRL